MKTYRGVRGQQGCVVTVDGQPLDPRLDLRQHSPGDFEWGYEGSAPWQLGLAILADFLGDDAKAMEQYQLFTETVIAELGGNEWMLTEQDIRSARDQVVEVPMDLKTLLDRARRIKL